MVEVPNRSVHLRVRNDLSEVLRIVTALEEICDAGGVPADVKADVTLAVDEIISNVIRHGEADESIEVRVDLLDNAVRIEIEDDGKAFNPLTAPAPKFDVPIEERRPGGMGIFLTKHMMSEITYKRTNGRNVLEMRRAFGSDAASTASRS